MILSYAIVLFYVFTNKLKSKFKTKTSKPVLQEQYLKVSRTITLKKDFLDYKSCVSYNDS